MVDEERLGSADKFERGTQVDCLVSHFFNIHCVPLLILGAGLWAGGRGRGKWGSSGLTTVTSN